MTQFDTIRKLFNVYLVSLDLFEQLPRVQWCALKILILRSFTVLPVKSVSRICLCYSSDVMRDLLQRRVNVFLSVWNKLRSSLDTNGEYLSFPAVF